MKQLVFAAVTAAAIVFGAGGPALAQAMSDDDDSIDQNMVADDLAREYLKRDLSAETAVRIALITRRDELDVFAQPDVADADALDDKFLLFVAEIRAAFYRDLGAQQAAAYLTDMQSRIAHAADVAQGLYEAGTMGVLDMMRIQAAQAGFNGDVALARATAAIENGRLANLIHVNPDDIKVPPRFLDVPPEPAFEPETVAGSGDLHWAIRQSYIAYCAARERAWTYQEIALPKRRTVAELVTVGAYMQADVFAVLSELSGVGAVMLTTIEAQRDFWLAENALRVAEVPHVEPPPPPRLGLGLPLALADRR